MKKTLVTLTAGSLLFAGIAASHEGATGIVRDRMDGMVAMRDAVRDLTPMMQGQAEYDREAVIAAAAVIERHAGNTMTALFPEGSDDDASYARAEIWQDWQAFEAMAMRLELVAGALAEAADSPPGSDLPGQMDNSSMMGGGSGMMGGGSSMMGGDAGPDAAMLAQMPVDRVFAVVAQACSACHTQFRTERD
ncbi:c-type cytochrome [Nioella nitratireducens]|uniref:c-type cytochrome n=1 Tax=Nioella nitratireducens TaxID=1287720 RepID=UPI0008FD0C4E|nr:cytochrome c [Nioella nitratireducens]